MLSYKGLIQKRATLRMEVASLAELPRLTSEQEIRFSAIEAQLADVELALQPFLEEQERERNMPALSSSFLGDDSPLEGDRAPTSHIGPDFNARSFFGVNRPDNGGWKSSEEFWGTIHAGLSDPRLVIGATQTGGAASEGGFAVPEELAFEMLDAAILSSGILQRVRLHPMKSDTLKIAGFDARTTDNKTLLGGWVPDWVAENGTLSVQTAKLRLIDLKTHKLGLLAEVSNELLADGQGFVEQLQNAMIEALRWELERVILHGTGVGQPAGLVSAVSTISVAKETGQAAATLLYENASSMLSRLHPALFKNAVWLASPTVIPQLTTMAVNVGTGGSHVQVLSNNGNEWMLLTKPIIFTEHMFSLGTVGDFVLADLSQYSLGVRKDFTVDRSAHIGFAKDVETFRGIVRCDGQPRWAEVFTPDQGSTLAPFVTVATRA